MKRRRVTATVFWLKLVISLTQWDKTVRLISATIPRPHAWEGSSLTFPASSTKSSLDTSVPKESSMVAVCFEINAPAVMVFCSSF